MKLTRRSALATLCAVPLTGQEKKAALPYPPQLEGAIAEVYKTIGNVKLSLWMYTPEAHKPTDKRPAIVFFFGGGWTGGSPRQFEQQCKYFASRGMVAITADYRVASRHQAKIVDCIRDAKSAIRWVRSNAARLGIDPDRIAAGGGSAGGHLAAATGTIEGLDDPGENLQTSSRPSALVLFNPALILGPVSEAGWSEEFGISLAARMGAPAESISPYHHIRKGAPPTIIFHGKADSTVPYRQAQAFDRKMREAGNRCQLEGYEGQTHGFFNFGRGENAYFHKTVNSADKFLVSLGYLK